MYVTHFAMTQCTSNKLFTACTAIPNTIIKKVLLIDLNKLLIHDSVYYHINAML